MEKTDMLLNLLPSENFSGSFLVQRNYFCKITIIDFPEQAA